MHNYFIIILSLYLTITFSIFVANNAEMTKYYDDNPSGEEIPVRKTKGYYMFHIVIFLIITLILFIIKFREVLSKNTFMNVSLLVLYVLLIVWFSYIIDKNRKNEPIDKGVITISFIVDITLLILSLLLLIDSSVSSYQGNTDKGIMGNYGPVELFNTLLKFES